MLFAPDACSRTSAPLPLEAARSDLCLGLVISMLLAPSDGFPLEGTSMLLAPDAVASPLPLPDELGLESGLCSSRRREFRGGEPRREPRFEPRDSARDRVRGSYLSRSGVLPLLDFGSSPRRSLPDSDVYGDLGRLGGRGSRTRLRLRFLVSKSRLGDVRRSRDGGLSRRSDVCLERSESLNPLSIRDRSDVFLDVSRLSGDRLLAGDSGRLGRSERPDLESCGAGLRLLERRDFLRCERSLDLLRLFWRLEEEVWLESSLD